MGVVSEVLGNYGACHEVEYNGKRYRLSLIDQRVKSAFEKSRFEKAKQVLALVKADLGEAEYLRRLQEKIDQYERGEFEIFSTSGMEYIKTVPGMRLLLSLIIDCPENELMGLILDKKDELVPMLGLVLRESFPGLKMEPKAEGDTSAVSADSEKSSVPVPNA